MRKISREILFISTIVASTWCVASAQGVEGISLIVDQDFLTPSGLNKDQNYTQGTVFTFHGPFAEYIYPLSCPRNWIDGLIDSLPFTLFRRGVENNYYSFSFGVGAFTPENIGVKEIITNDRPYYSSLVFSSQRISVRRPRVLTRNVHPKVLVTDFTINIMGLYITREFQTYVHRKMIEDDPGDPDNRPIPIGWKNQISDGGEPSLLYRSSFIQTVMDFSVPHNNVMEEDFHIFQMFHNVGIALGYYTYLTTGVTMRLGLMRSKVFLKSGGVGSVAGLVNKRFDSLTQKANTTDSKEEKEALLAERRKSIWNTWELYLFTSANSSLFAYNAALSGQFRVNPEVRDHRFSYSKINPLVFTYDLGIAFSWGWINLGYALTGRTPEFYGSASRSHTWGSVFLSVQKPLTTQ